MTTRLLTLAALLLAAPAQATTLYPEPMNLGTRAIDHTAAEHRVIDEASAYETPQPSNPVEPLEPYNPEPNPLEYIEIPSIYDEP